MSNRITFIVLAFMFAIILAVWLLGDIWNSMSAQMFGKAAVPQQVSRQDQIADRKKLRAEHDAKAAAKLESEKYSSATLKAAAHSGVPKPLTPEEFNPVTGAVRWPAALMGNDYELLRQDLEQLLKERAAASGDADHAKKAHGAAEELLAQLKTHIRTLSTNDYVAAHHFMDSLIYALRPKD